MFASPQLSPRKSASALDASEGIQQRSPLLLSPDALVRALVIHACGIERKSSKCRVSVPGRRVGSVRARPADPDSRVPGSSGIRKGRPTEHSLAYGTLCTARDRARLVGWRLVLVGLTSFCHLHERGIRMVNFVLEVFNQIFFSTVRPVHVNTEIVSRLVRCLFPSTRGGPRTRDLGNSVLPNFAVLSAGLSSMGLLYSSNFILSSLHLRVFLRNCSCPIHAFFQVTFEVILLVCSRVSLETSPFVSFETGGARCKMKKHERKTDDVVTE